MSSELPHSRQWHSHDHHSARMLVAHDSVKLPGKLTYLKATTAPLEDHMVWTNSARAALMERLLCPRLCAGPPPKRNVQTSGLASRHWTRDIAKHVFPAFFKPTNPCRRCSLLHSWHTSDGSCSNSIACISHVRTAIRFCTVSVL